MYMYRTQTNFFFNWLAPCMVVFSVGNYLALPSQAVPPPVPNPFLCIYGHHGGAGVTDAFRDFIPPFNVIEGTSNDAVFINELRAQGKIYAAHVNNLSSATTADLVAAWRAPFDNTLGGQLAGGYDAIAIDELHSAATDGTAQSGRVIAALQQLRSLYPDKLIFVAAVWQYAQNSQNYVNLLNAVNDYTDMLMLEKYMREGNLSYWSVAYADKLKAAVPGILSKSVFGLYIAQHGFVADDRWDVGYWGMLDEQIHRIRNDSDASTMPGLMFWVYYRTETELTPDYCARLCDHYYVQGNTGYLGDGQTTQLISNSGFDSSTSGWVLSPGTGGTLARFDYGSEGVRSDHSADPIRNMGQGPSYVSHGSHGLKMVRGSAHSEASYQINVDTDLTYTVSAWVLANVNNTRAKVTVTESNGAFIEAEEITHAQTIDYARIAFNFVPTSSPVKIVLNDESTSPGRILYWDFVELEDAFPAGAGPPAQEPDFDFTWGASTGLFFPAPSFGILPNLGDEVLAQLYLAPDHQIDGEILPGGGTNGDDIFLDSFVVRNNGATLEEFGTFQKQFQAPFQDGTIYIVIFSSTSPVGGDRYYQGPGLAATDADTLTGIFDMNVGPESGNTWTETIMPPDPQLLVRHIASWGFLDENQVPILPNVGDEALVQLIFSPDGVGDMILSGGIPDDNDVVLDARIVRNNGALFEEYAFFARKFFLGPFQPGFIYGIVYEGADPQNGQRFYAGPMVPTESGTQASPNQNFYDTNGDPINGNTWNGTVETQPLMLIDWRGGAGFIDDQGNPILPNVGDEALVQLVYSPDGVADRILSGAQMANDDFVIDTTIVRNNGGLWEEYGLFDWIHYQGPYLPGFIYAVAYENTNPLLGARYYAGPMQATVEIPAAIQAPTTYEMNIDFVLGDAWNGAVSQLFMHYQWSASFGFVDGQGDPILPSRGSQALIQLIYSPDAVADQILSGGVPDGNDITLFSSFTQNSGGFREEYGFFGPYSVSGAYQPGFVYGVIYESRNPQSADQYYAGALQATTENESSNPALYEMNSSLVDGNTWNRTVASADAMNISWAGTAGFIDDLGNPVLPNHGAEAAVQLIYSPDNLRDPILPGGVPGENDAVLALNTVRNNGGQFEDYAFFGYYAYSGNRQPGFIYGIIYENINPQAGDQFYAGPLQPAPSGNGATLYNLNPIPTSVNTWNDSVIAQNAMLDFDLDGLPNDFEKRHFGDSTIADANDDSDLDRLSNLEEHIAGTDPTDDASFFGIESIVKDQLDIEVTLRDTSVNRGYVLEFRDGMSGAGGWTTANEAPAGSDGSTLCIDVGGSTSPSRGYRGNVYVP